MNRFTAEHRKTIRKQVKTEYFGMKKYLSNANWQEFLDNMVSLRIAHEEINMRLFGLPC